MDYENEIERGEALFAEGQIDQAETLFQRVLENQPKNHEALNNLGAIHYIRGEINIAEDYFLKALAIKENYPDALLNLVKVYGKRKGWKEASVQLENYMSTSKKDLDLLSQLGIIYWQMGDSKKARDLWSAALNRSHDQDNKSIREHELLALLSEAKAIEYRLNVARHFMARCQYYYALLQLQRIMSLNPKNHEAAKTLNLLYYGEDYPKQILIEPTNKCKMGCPGCGGRGGKIGYMEVDQFAALMQELGPHVEKLVLHNRGDSFYHPGIYDMLEIVGKYPHIQSLIHTHGSLDIDAEAVVKLGGLHELVFSVDGATQESYQPYRRNGDIEKCFDNMRTLQDTKKKYGAHYPIITWKFIVMKTNEHEMHLAPKMAKEIGCDKLQFAPFGVGWMMFEQKRPEYWLPYFEKFVPTDKRYLDVDYAALMRGEVKRRVLPDYSHCFLVNITKPIIRWNGDVAPCCACLEPHANTMGNVFKQGSYKEIWESEKYRRFRRQAVISCKVMMPCKQCHMVN